jgi:hypothetical protein
VIDAHAVVAGLRFPSLTQLGLRQSGIGSSFVHTFTEGFPRIKNVTLEGLCIEDDDIEEHPPLPILQAASHRRCSLELETLSIDAASLDAFPLLPGIALKLARLRLEKIGYHHYPHFLHALQSVSPHALELEFHHSAPLWLEQLPALAPQLRNLSVHVLFTSRAWLGTTVSSHTSTLVRKRRLVY